MVLIHQRIGGYLAMLPMAFKNILQLFPGLNILATTGVPGVTKVWKFCNILTFCNILVPLTQEIYLIDKI